MYEILGTQKYPALLMEEGKVWHALIMDIS